MSTSVLPPVATTTQFLVDSAALLKTAQLAMLLIPRNPVVPVLDHLLLRVGKAAGPHAPRFLRVISGDLEHTFTSRALPVECVSTREESALCVPAKQLTDLLRNISAQPLTLRFDAQQETGPVLNVQAALPHSLLPGGTGRAQYSLCSEPAAEYPRIPARGLTQAIVAVPGHLLLSGLKLALPVVSSDELRPAMGGVYVQVSASTLRLVATDGHRLVRYTKEDQHTLTGAQTITGVIPRRAAQVLTSLISRQEKVELEWLADSLLVKMEAGELRIRLIDERYPDYENVLPTALPNVLTAHRCELLAGVKRCALFASKTNHQLVFRLAPGACELVAEDRDFQNSAAESVPGSYAGEPMAIGLNAAFLSAFLLALPCQNVKLSMSTPQRAVTLQSADAEDGLLLLLMPLMLSNLY